MSDQRCNRRVARRDAHYSMKEARRPRVALMILLVLAWWAERSGDTKLGRAKVEAKAAKVRAEAAEPELAHIKAKPASLGAFANDDIRVGEVEKDQDLTPCK